MVKDVSVAATPLHLGHISKAVRRCIGAPGGILWPSAGVLESLREAVWARCPISIVGLVGSLWPPRNLPVAACRGVAGAAPRAPSNAQVESQEPSHD